MLRDDSANTWLKNPKNIAEWERLYQKCPWRVATLSPSFCRAWLRHYAAHWRPVLVMDEHDGQLSRLMPLAANNHLLTGMGAHQAEYQGWLSAMPTGEQAFLAEALRFCRIDFPSLLVRLRYLAPGLPERCGDSLEKATPHLELQHHQRPLLPLAKNILEKALRKPANRSKLNRLAAQGELEIDFPTDRDEIAQTLSELAPLYDFRQGAINDVCPFVDDPAKLPFLVDWLSQANPGDFHLGRIRVAGRLVSGLLTVNGRDTASVAIIGYSPVHGRQSPGKLQIYNSALALAREGLSCLDLTPGGDPWKERFAKEHDQVAELTCYPSRASFVRHRLTESAYRYARLGMRLLGIDASAAGKRFRSIRARFNAKVGKLRPSRTYWYRLRFNLQSPSIEITPSDLEVGVNRFEHLVRYRSSILSRASYLSRCLEHLQRGGTVYSVAQGNRLLASLCRRDDPQALRRTDQGKCRPTATTKSDTILFQDLYYQKDAQGFSAARLVLKSALKEVKDEGFGGSIMMELEGADLPDAGGLAADITAEVEKWYVSSWGGICRISPRDSEAQRQ